MQNISEFFAMGGYAGFVWPAYGLSIAVLTWLVVDSIRGLRSGQRTLEILEQTNPRRRSATAPADGPATEESGQTSDT